jgi:hypothetical protein
MFCYNFVTRFIHFPNIYINILNFPSIWYLRLLYTARMMAAMHLCEILEEREAPFLCRVGKQHIFSRDNFSNKYES